MCPCRPPSSLNVAICWHKGRQFSGCRLLPLSSHGRYKVIRPFFFFNPPPQPTPFSSSRSVSLVFQKSEAESCHVAAVISMCKGLRCRTRWRGRWRWGRVKGEKIPGSGEGLLHSCLINQPGSGPAGFPASTFPPLPLSSRDGGPGLRIIPGAPT